MNPNSVKASATLTHTTVTTSTATTSTATTSTAAAGAVKASAVKASAPRLSWRAGLRMAGVVLERAIAGLRDRETSLQITVSCAKTQTSAAPWDKNTQCAVLSISQKRCATLGAQTPLDLLISTALRGIHEKAPSGFSYSWPWIGMISSGGWRCSASYAAAGAIRIRHFPVATLPERHTFISISSPAS